MKIFNCSLAICLAVSLTGCDQISCCIDDEPPIQLAIFSPEESDVLQRYIDDTIFFVSNRGDKTVTSEINLAIYNDTTFMAEYVIVPPGQAVTCYIKFDQDTDTLAYFRSEESEKIDQTYLKGNPGRKISPIDRPPYFVLEKRN